MDQSWWVHVLMLGLMLQRAALAVDPVHRLDPELHHIRNGADREWTEFPEHSEATSYEITFNASSNTEEQTLRMTQVDVKQTWNVALNGKNIGRLHRDENEIIAYWSIPRGSLIDGSNVLTVSCASPNVDDIRLGDVAVIAAPQKKFLNQCRLSVLVRDASTGRPLPSRLTILNNGRLMTVGAESNDQMAVRAGVIYCTGRAEFGLPPGEYSIIAGRGPEYGIHKQVINIKDGEQAALEFSISREVPTDGFVACDTHVHTVTFSGHGDATDRERMITLAGEGIELPIATDHNTNISYEELSRELGVRQFFTPVIGNEVTTRIGHFNVFPIASIAEPAPDYRQESWEGIFDSIFSTAGVRVAILNHSRDIHSQFRPFGPEHFLPGTATNLDGWELRANAMEIINSGAQQTDMMRPVYDWMALLNAGHRLTPVGCSDSHDVARHFVGQGRTYIQCDDIDPSRIDVDTAVENFLAGRVTVGCGLFANIRVNNDYGPGETVMSSQFYQAKIDVRGPGWIEAEEVEVFLNGIPLQTFQLDQQDRGRAGIKSVFTVDVPVSKQQDAFLVAVVRGPGVRDLYWPIAKPYQATSPDWTPRFMAVTGAVWIDADGDGIVSSAKDYAISLCEQTRHDPQETCVQVQRFDRPVAMHVAYQLLQHNERKFVAEVLPIARQQNEIVRDAFLDLYDQWKTSQRARAGANPVIRPTN